MSNDTFIHQKMITYLGNKRKLIPEIESILQEVCQTLKNIDKVTNILKKSSIYFEQIGITQKNMIEINKVLKIKVIELKKLNSLWFSKYFAEN